MSGVVFLPIVERELRVAARKRSTFWVRLVAALVALAIGVGCLVLNELGLAGVGAPSLGKALFGSLTWLSLAAVLSAGLFFTSDCLSEEKREGTIGFLFLTDLRGYDIVLGKLLATSARGFCALLAVFPILGVTLLMGGVTGVELWKTVLALVNALLFSLAVGLFVSALSRDSHKALGATLLLLLLLTAGGPAGDAGLAELNNSPWTPLLSLASPGYLFIEAGAWAQTHFWQALLINQVIAWTFLGLSCLLLRHTWRERRPRASAALRGWAYRWKFGAPRRRERLRRILLSLNPVMWLACRERWQAASVWIVAILLAGGFVAIFAPAWPAEVWMIWSPVAGLVVLLLYLGVATQAGRFFVEARRSGLMELLLATPLTEKRIVQGQWRALLRVFGLPVLVCLAAQLTGAVLVQQMTWDRLAIATGGPAPVTQAATTGSVTVVTSTVTTVVVRPRVTATVRGANLPAAAATNRAVQPGARPGGRAAPFSLAGFTPPGVLVALAVSVSTTLAIAANLVALAWFGMLMGLYSKSANLAALKTILFVQVIPWFVLSFASAMLVGLLLLYTTRGGTGSPPLATGFWMPLLMSLLATVLALAKDIGFVLIARHWLLSHFRERVTQAAAPIRGPVPPLIRRAGGLASPHSGPPQKSGGRAASASQSDGGASAPPAIP